MDNLYKFNSLSDAIEHFKHELRQPINSQNMPRNNNIETHKFETDMSHYSSKEQVKNTSNDDLLTWELQNWKTTTTETHDRTNTVTNRVDDDLISFNDDNEDYLVVIDDTSKQTWTKEPEKPKLEGNSKYYEDLKTVFKISSNYIPQDELYSCTEPLQLGKVKPIQKLKSNISEHDTSICTETVTLGKVIPMKTTENINILKDSIKNTDNFKLETAKERDDSPGLLYSREKSADLVDLFENINVTPRDIWAQQQTNKLNSVLLKTGANLAAQRKTENVNKDITQERAFRTSEIKDLVPTSQTMKSKDSILAVKGDKILQVTGSNVVIKCDRAYVISAGKQDVCCKCHKETNANTGNNETKDELLADISKSTFICEETSKIKQNEMHAKPVDTEHKKTETVPIRTERSQHLLQGMKYFGTVPTVTQNKNKNTTLVNYEDSSTSKHNINKDKATYTEYKNIESVPIRTENPGFSPQDANKKLQMEQKNEKRVTNYELEVLEENHAKTRVKWQRQRVAIDEFIHKGKVIK